MLEISTKKSYFDNILNISKRGYLYCNVTESYFSSKFVHIAFVSFNSALKFFKTLYFTLYFIEDKFFFFFRILSGAAEGRVRPERDLSSNACKFRIAPPSGCSGRRARSNEVVMCQALYCAIHCGRLDSANLMELRAP